MLDMMGASNLSVLAQCLQHCPGSRSRTSCLASLLSCHPSPRLDGMVQITACFMVASSLPRLSPCFASFCLTRCIALIEAVLCCSQHLPGHGRFTSLVASSLPLFDSVLLTANWCLIAASSQPHCPLLLSLLLAAPACNGTNRIKLHACINPPS